MKRLLIKKFFKKIRKLRKIIKKIKKKFVKFLYLSKRKNNMGCNCGKSKKANGEVIITDVETRLFMCDICPYSVETPIVGITCGKLARPEYDDKGKELTCGCILKLKTKLKKARCPQGKW
jgi:hypothetical protein|tara:strand:+ start:195 stop:554 length:360 start_codon:yes stop_codon:yes gene_type:complete